MASNKTGKYLKYAVGEIVLVVIGILIALQINNWNQSKILKIEEVKSLESLHSEFLENLQKFDDIHALQLIRNDAINQILFSDISNYSLSSLDSLYLKANFNPSTPKANIGFKIRSPRIITINEACIANSVTIIAGNSKAPRIHLFRWANSAYRDFSGLDSLSTS